MVIQRSWKRFSGKRNWAIVNVQRRTQRADDVWVMSARWWMV